MIASRKELAAAFAAAREVLAATCSSGCGKREYICHCLSLVQERGEIADRVSVEARQLIRYRLNQNAPPSTTFSQLESWIVAHHPGLQTAIQRDHRDNSGRQMQATRLAWLNSLVEEFSTEEA